MKVDIKVALLTMIRFSKKKDGLRSDLKVLIINSHMNGCCLLDCSTGQ